MAPSDSSSEAPPRRRRFRFLRRRRPGETQLPRKRRRFDLKKALFILPNAFTVASIFCGFFAIVLATSGGGPEAFQQAGVSLFLAAFFDGIDGRVARLTRTQSDFGVQIDSLADVISFGVAPAVLLYEWALAPLGHFGVVVAFIWCACGAIRLARFNVLAARGIGSSKYFQGLPIPGAATMAIAVVIAQCAWLHEEVRAVEAVVAMVLVLSYLMVSRVRFRTFKDFRPGPRNTPVLIGVVVALGTAIAVLKTSLALVFAVGAYILWGLIEEVLFYKKRQNIERDERAANDRALVTSAASAASVADGGAASAP